MMTLISIFIQLIWLILFVVTCGSAIGVLANIKEDVEDMDFFHNSARPFTDPDCLTPAGRKCRKIHIICLIANLLLALVMVLLSQIY